MIDAALIRQRERHECFRDAFNRDRLTETANEARRFADAQGLTENRSTEAELIRILFVDDA